MSKYRAKADGRTITAAGFTILLLALLLANPTPFLNSYGGRVVSKDSKSDYLGHGGLNNQHCWTDPGECLRLCSVWSSGADQHAKQPGKPVRMSRFTTNPTLHF